VVLVLLKNYIVSKLISRYANETSGSYSRIMTQTQLIDPNYCTMLFFPTNASFTLIAWGKEMLYSPTLTQHRLF